MQQNGFGRYMTDVRADFNTVQELIQFYRNYGEPILSTVGWDRYCSITIGYSRHVQIFLGYCKEQSAEKNAKFSSKTCQVIWSIYCLSLQLSLRSKLQTQKKNYANILKLSFCLASSDESQTNAIFPIFKFIGKD